MFICVNSSLMNNSKGNFRSAIIFLYHLVLCYIIILPRKRQVSSHTRLAFPPPFILLTLSLFKTWPSRGVNRIVGPFGRERDLREPRFRVTRFSAASFVWFISVFSRVTELQESLRLRAVSLFLKNQWGRMQNKKAYERDCERDVRGTPTSAQLGSLNTRIFETWTATGREHFPR